MNTFAVDDLSTWPANVARLLSDAYPKLQNGPDGRPHFAAHDALVAEVGRRLGTFSVLARHCTRLCPDEIAAVKAQGMQPLSRTMMVGRVRRRVEAGDLTEAVAERLLGGRRACDAARRGQLWFSLTRYSAVSWGRGGMWHLWGGEALYGEDLENNDFLSLGTFGSSCIVELAVPVEWIGQDMVAEAAVRHFEQSNGSARAGSMEALAVGVPLGPDRVLGVLTDGDRAFVDLLTRPIAAHAERSI